MSVYVPLFPEYGGGAKGFRCETCERVTRTENGMKTHLRRVHGLRIQGDLFPNEQTRLLEGVEAKESELSPRVDGSEASGSTGTDSDNGLLAFAGKNDPGSKG